jgi:outer membrane immunogenic protein
MKSTQTYTQMMLQILKPALVATAMLVVVPMAMADDAENASSNTGLMKDFDTLGGNDVLLEKARALNPDAQIRVVQDRIVSRRSRVEFAPEFSSVLGGDAYNKTNNAGFNVQYHFTPQWSVGLKYNYSFNQLRPEGENLLTDVSVDGKARIPDIDFPKQEALLLVNWYPIYGKMNLYELGVVHFDIYALAGGGQVELKSGMTTAYTGGAGLGLWVSQHLSTRFELRYEGYTAKRFNGNTNMNTAVAGVQVGYLL